MKKTQLDLARKKHIEKRRKIWEDFKIKHEHKHKCQCGCNQYIKVQKHHMHRKFPSYIQGHHGRITLKNKTHSIQSRINMSLGHTKEKVFSDFKQKQNKRIRNSAKYKQWRQQILERDEFKCIFCGNNNELEVHHIKPFSKLKDEKFNIDNGITCCVICHSIIDKHRRIKMPSKKIININIIDGQPSDVKNIKDQLKKIKETTDYEFIITNNRVELKDLRELLQTFYDLYKKYKELRDEKK